MSIAAGPPSGPRRPAWVGACRRRPGARFNLVELVVVLTALVGLVSLLLPVIYQAGLVARTTGCSGNLKELGTWAKMYANANGGKLPAYEDGWVNEIARLGSQTVDQTAVPRGVFACPSQPNVTLAGALPPAQYWRGTHYGINQHLASKLLDANGKPLPYWGRTDLRNVPRNTKVLMADCAGGNYFGIAEYDPTVAGLSRSGVTYADGLPPQAVTPFPYLRHNEGAGNFLFLDGHVETRKSWPEFMLGPGTAGYEFWHGEQWWPGRGDDEPPSVKKD